MLHNTNLSIPSMWSYLKKSFSHWIPKSSTPTVNAPYVKTSFYPQFIRESYIDFISIMELYMCGTHHICIYYLYKLIIFGGPRVSYEQCHSCILEDYTILRSLKLCIGVTLKSLSTQSSIIVTHVFEVYILKYKCTIYHSNICVKFRSLTTWGAPTSHHKLQKANLSC